MLTLHQGPTLFKAAKEAIPSQTIHTAIYAEFTASLPQEEVAKWTEAMEQWERDPMNKVNPFETTVACTYSIVLREIHC